MTPISVCGWNLLDLRTMNQKRSWFLLLTAYLILPASAVLSGDRKDRLLRVTQDSIRSDNGHLVKGWHVSTKKGIYASLPTSDGKSIFFIIRKYVKSTQAWSAGAQIVCFDHGKKSIVWTSKTNAFDFAVCDDRLLVKGYRSTSYYSQNEAQPVWEQVGSRLVFDDCKAGFGITSKGKIIDLRLGTETSAGQGIPTIEGIQEVIQMNDGSSLVSSSGLTKLTPEHAIETGIREKTSFQSTKRIIGQTAAFLVLAGAMGAAVNTGAVVPVTGPLPNTETRVSGLCSNVLLQNNRIYQAYEGKLVCYDERLNTIWSTRFEEDKAGMSRITLSGDTILLVNMGTGRLGNRLCHAGHPGIYLFNESTGKVIQYSDIETKGIGILDVIFHDNSINLLTEREELTYSISLGCISKRMKIGTEGAYSTGRYMNPKGIYHCYLAGDTCTPFLDSNGNDRYVALPHKILHLSDESNEVSSAIPAEEQCRTSHHFDDFILLHCANGLNVVDFEGRIKESFQLKGDLIVSGPLLLFREENKKSLYLFDAKSFDEDSKAGSER